jgi:hypothetical protein
MNFEAPSVAIYFGLVLLALYLWIWLSPVKAFAALKNFPRSTWPAWIFVGISLIWFALNLNQVDLGRFNTLKVGLWAAVPLAFYLIVTFTPDLLAVRGLCTFCLLAGKSVLVAVRWHGSPAQFVIALLVYVVMVKCMFLVVYPHFWIRGVTKVEANPMLKKLSVVGGTLFSVALLACGFLSF